MPVMTYKQAVKKLDVSMTFFRNVIERIEFSDYRLIITFKENRKLKNGQILSVKRAKRAIRYNKNFVKLFNKLTERTKK